MIGRLHLLLETLSMGKSGIEDKPKCGHSQEHNIWWKDEFEYFGHTGCMSDFSPPTATGIGLPKWTSSLDIS